MPNVIADRAYKISFLQTIPGEEFNVVQQLHDNCTARGLKDYSILKSIGSYDLIFIYASRSGYDSILTPSGPIKGIMRTSRFFCFQYLLDPTDNNQFFQILNSSVFTSLCFIKLKPNVKQPVAEIKQVLETCITEPSSNIRGFGFGTLGWVDLVIIKTHKSLNDLVTNVFWATTNPVFPVLKTYSYLGINHNNLPSINDIPNDLVKLKMFFKDQSQLQQEICDSIRPKIFISFAPSASKEVVEFWAGKDRGYEVLSIAGKDDLCVLPPPHQKRLDQLLTDLLHFRATFQGTVYGTETKFDKITKEVCAVKRAGDFEEMASPPIAEYNAYIYDDLEKIFDSASALNLSANLNSLNGLFQGISSDAFLDLRSYFKYIHDTGKTIREEKGEHEAVSFANQSANLLKIGAELRLYGTHGTMEEAVGQFTKLRGGVQKSLLAIEYFPSSIIKRVSSGKNKWSGFVVTGSREFLNQNAVIIVPYGCLWKPTEWWPIYHETAHILVYNRKSLLNPNIPEIKIFLAGKEDPDYWFHLVNEFAAEVIGYEIGFFSDIDLYMDLVWKYLRDLLPGHDNIAPFFVYCIRTCFVRFYDDLYNKKSLTETDILDLDKMYTYLLDHIIMIRDKYFSEGSYREHFDFSDAYFIAAQNAPIFKELYLWTVKVLRKFCMEFNIRPAEEYKHHKNTAEVITEIMDGRRWEGDVLCPEAVLYNLLKRDRLTYEQSMSFIMTLWNLQKNSIFSESR